MYRNHIVEKNVFYNTSQSNKPQIYYVPFLGDGYYHSKKLNRVSNGAWMAFDGTRRALEATRRTSNVARQASEIKGTVTEAGG